jgi:starch synthase
MTIAASHSDLRVLFVTPEIYPLNKTGGLGDVSAALPDALRALNVDVRLLIPGYPQVLSGLRNKEKVAEFPDQLAFPASVLLSAKLQSDSRKELPLYIIDCPALYSRDGGPYADETGHAWPDNALRFALLSKIGAILSSDASPLSWLPHVVHCNDWQTGLVPAYLNFHQGQKAASLMAIHNLAFQGVFPPDTVAQLGLPPASFDVNGIEYYGSVSFLKAGLFYSDHIVTVSPTYALEIQTSPLGFGMEGLLSVRHAHISGIVNGISDDWDPATDPHLVQNYTVNNLGPKIANKIALQQQLGLEVDPEVPLLGGISRLTHQKGYDLLLGVATQVIETPVQLALLGSGEWVLEQELNRLAKANSGKIAVRIGFDEKLAHLMEGGMDLFLMPSRFEPCGLNQMYSQRYGTPPVVHATGGLLDTVVDCSTATLADGTASGFLFHDMTANSFADTIQRAITAYHDKPVWHRLMQNGMTKDFSWRSSASAYRKIYVSLRANGKT